MQELGQTEASESAHLGERRDQPSTDLTRDQALTALKQARSEAFAHGETTLLAQTTMALEAIHQSDEISRAANCLQALADQLTGGIVQTRRV